MRLSDDEARLQQEWENLRQAEANVHERELMLEACLKDTVRELLERMEEDSSPKAVDEYISEWFLYSDEESRQYDHIGR